MAYTPGEIEEVFTKICNKIEEEGLSLRKTLQPRDMPSSQTFYKWLEEDEEKSKRYARACEMRADFYVDEMLEIADESNADAWVGDDGVTRIDGQAVQRSKLMVDTRKWIASKLHPRKYGNKVDVTSDGKQVKQVPAVKVEFVDFSEDDNKTE
ncbi:conserved hypothetical protein [Tenacibaculum maritimum]|uniref:terminase small subunit-like protein n=1 Tax=Tenacibaculum maritimum TaxID=107401 RepID=UPI0012E654D7|nr:terminase small subunit protein [Tenacibaculum maritimum]CAA0144195.1 conserved hypothetical protein [Tenacibaculum maritimum]